MSPSSIIRRVVDRVGRELAHRPRLFALDALLVAYAGVVVGNLKRGVISYVYAHSADVGKRSPWLWLFITVTLYIFALVVLPYFLLRWNRARITRARLAGETPEVARRRNYVAEHFMDTSSAITIFFPDVYEDELSVSAYTGIHNATQNQHGWARHLEASAIIANPHVAQFANSPQSAAHFSFPELRVEAVDARSPRWKRLLVWASERYAFLFRAQERGNLERLYHARDEPVSYAQTPDVEHALRMTLDVITSDPTPNRTPFVLFGCRRGASVALEVLARLPREHRYRIKGVVLEGLVTDQIRLKKLTGSYMARHPGELLHDPIAVVRSLPDHIEASFLLVTSRADASSDTSRLFDFGRYLFARDLVHSTVYLLKSRGGHYATDDSSDKMLYEEAALDFYAEIEARCQPAEGQ